MLPCESQWKHLSITMKTAIVLLLFLIHVKSAKILGYFPTPSISHQVVFRPLIHELVKRGHQVVLITTDPAFPEGETPANLTEIDLHDLTYGLWKNNASKELEHDEILGKPLSRQIQTEMMHEALTSLLETELTSEPVQKLLRDKSQKFDLLLIEAYLKGTLVLSHIYKNVPVIQMSSFGPMPWNMEILGAPVHPILYPSFFTRKINNFGPWDTLKEIYEHFMDQRAMEKSDRLINEMIKRVVGPDSPSVDELVNNVDLLFLNVHPIWEFNRPVPPNVIYTGAMHLKSEKELPRDLKSYLDSSKYGVIYVSFGTNVDPRLFPPLAEQIFTKVLATLPYNVLWKWHNENISEYSTNINVSKWFPQADLLKHPNIKLFITQGGLQSTDEAIEAGVPMVGIPMLGDQWYNVDLYVRHGIGVRLDIENISEENFRKAISDVIENNDEFRQNILKLRKIMRDQSQTSLERAVWWTEYVLRHGGAKHLRSPAANMTWFEYFRVELLIYVFFFLISLLIIKIVIVYYVLKLLGILGSAMQCGNNKSKVKIK